MRSSFNIILLLYLLSACDRNIAVGPEQYIDSEITEAREWYETSLDKSFKTDSTKNIIGHARQVKQPIWEKAIITRKNGKVYIDIPLQYFRSETSMSMVMKTVMNSPDSGQLHRSMFITNSDQEYSLVVLNIIPSATFEMPVENYSYFSLMSLGFDGRMMYTDLSGNFKGGHVFKDGKAIRSIRGFKRIK